MSLVGRSVDGPPLECYSFPGPMQLAQATNGGGA
jgi:hypothetical protein